ncbi:hypothetical protein ACFQ60_26105 [Streptomyces zhihengii]
MSGFVQPRARGRSHGRHEHAVIGAEFLQIGHQLPLLTGERDPMVVREIDKIAEDAQSDEGREDRAGQRQRDRPCRSRQRSPGHTRLLSPRKRMPCP